MDLSELERQSVNSSSRHPWEITRARVVEFLLKKNASSIQHITDVGSGDVFVLRHLANQHPLLRFTAVDSAYNENLVQQLHRLPGTGNISFHTSLPAGIMDQTDIVLLMDVLEHCENDSSLVKEVVSPYMVTKETLVLITVPAFQSLFSQHDALLKHYRRYSRKQIRKVVSREGLAVISSGYFFFSLIPARMFQKLFERMGLRRTRSSIDNWKGNKIITKIISSILWADFRICHALSSLGIHLPGLSCYCLCKKSPS